MAAKETVVKMSIGSEKEKTNILQVITKLQGIDRVSVDAERGTLSVIGKVDPFLIIKHLRKTGKNADLVAVRQPRSSDEYYFSPSYVRQYYPPPPPPLLPPPRNDYQFGAIDYQPQSYDGSYGHCTIL